MKLFYVPAFLLLFVLPNFTKAQGNLLVIPRRVVFEANKRIQEINLANTGSDSSRFTTSFVHYRMEKNGGVTEINTPDSGQYFADDFLRFFPRSVSLGPNESQAIKLQLVNTSQLKPGEYRSHLYFRAVPKPERALVGTKDTSSDPAAISIKLVPVFGVSIPVIIRVGPSTTTSDIKNATVKVENGKPMVEIEVTRTGNFSVFGDFKVNYINSAGVSSQIGLLRGIAVYTPTPSRMVMVPLEPKSNQDLHKGKLQIIYEAQPDAKPQKFAEATIALK